jgi:hypothetical protein
MLAIRLALGMVVIFGFVAMKTGEFLWVLRDNDKLVRRVSGFWLSRGKLWVIVDGMEFL